MLRPKNEWKLCDAVARLIEERAATTRTNAHSPERERAEPPVEYRFDLGKDQFALEHTFIEPFEDETRAAAHFDAFVRPILEAVEFNMPRPGVYRLAFPLDPSAGLNPRERAQVQKRITEWIFESAMRLHAEKPEMMEHDKYGYDNHVREKPEGIPFELLLSREIFRDIPPKGNGRLFFARIAPHNYEQLRVERIRRAFNMKCPKLALCQADGARAVLILEANDPSLTNHWVVGEAVRAVLSERSDLPEEIFYADTSIEKEWTVWSMWRQGVMWPDDETEKRYSDFSPDDLRAV